MYKFLIRPILFLLDAEKAHHVTTSFLKIFLKLPLTKIFIRKIYSIQDVRLEREVFGLKFKNPVGLAAGFDKDAKFFEEFACFGFGFIEIGTVTPKAQKGNPKPRLFRLPGDQALINRMGFNNDGAAAVSKRLSEYSQRKTQNPKSKIPNPKSETGNSIIIGGNIGKNALTPNEDAISDYETCFEVLFDVVDYFVVNVSSPNTPGLRALQEKKPLTELLRRLKEKNISMCQVPPYGWSPEGGETPDTTNPKPILLKIAPDLTNEQLDDIIDIVISVGIDGVIATNTTVSRDELKTGKEKLSYFGEGGLSGKPTKKRSTEVIKYLSEKSGGAFPIIGVGGIHSAADAMEKLNAGASLVQVYTGFVYEGAGLVRKINRAILDIM